MGVGLWLPARPVDHDACPRHPRPRPPLPSRRVWLRGCDYAATTQTPTWWPPVSASRPPSTLTPLCTKSSQSQVRRVSLELHQAPKPSAWIIGSPASPIFASAFPVPQGHDLRLLRPSGRSRRRCVRWRPQRAPQRGRTRFL